MTRRRFRYDVESKQMVEVGQDWTDAERRAPVGTEAVIYANLRATDGTPLDSRRKHREHLQHTGLAMASDYTESWAKAAKQREDFYAGRHKHEGLRQALGQAIDQVRRKR